VIRDGAGVLALSVGQAEARGFKPHKECDPANAPAEPGATPGGAARPPAPKPRPLPVYVWVNARDRYYHRADCRKLGATRAKILLDANSVKEYWPCTVCRPPIRKRKD